MQNRNNALFKLENNRRLRPYKRLCFAFLSYLHDKEKILICFDGYDSDADDYIFATKPYMHRWKPEYTKYRLAQFYALEEWAKTNPLPLTMLTFTTYHDNPRNKRILTIDESWRVLKDGFRKASHLITLKIKKSPYIWVVEPQPDSGYPHIHAAYFTEFSEDEQDRLKNHWSRVLGVGDYKHGLDFAINQEYRAGDITSLRNYFIKYLSKTFIDTINEWTPEELVFNAVAWKNGYRFFGCSQDISAAMSIKDGEKQENFQWLSTSIQDLNPASEKALIRINTSPYLITSG